MDDHDTERLIDEARAAGLRLYDVETPLSLSVEEAQDLGRLLLDLADHLATARALWVGLAAGVAAWAPRDLL